jgi:hypothetical protein
MMAGQEHTRVLDTPYVYMKLEDGILRGYYKENVRITAEIARTIVKERFEYFDRKSFPALIFDNGVKSIDKEARVYFSSPEGIIGLTAACLVLKSSFSMVLGNFLLKLNRPIIPVRIFTNELSALKWLEQFREG